MSTAQSIQELTSPTSHKTYASETSPPQSLEFRRGEIRALTGLRGVAACHVMLRHFYSSRSGSGALHRVIVHGYLAVDLFFILSGFVMAYTYARSFGLHPTFSTVRSFLYKRLGRIYPLYLFITLLTCLLVYKHWVEGIAPTTAIVLFNVLLCQAWGFAESIGGPTWSISTEFAAYLVFPILVTRIVKGRPLWKWIAGTLGLAALILVATRSAADFHQSIAGDTPGRGTLDAFAGGTIYPLLRCLGGFTLGTLAYALALTQPMRRMIDRPALADGLSVVVLILLALPRTDLLIAILFVPLVMLLTSGQGVIARLLSKAFVHWLGVVSYSIYLTHRLIWHLLREPIRNSLAARHVAHGPFIAAVAVFAIVLAVSAITYYAIEKPARNWLRALSRQRSSSILSEPSAP